MIVAALATLRPGAEYALHGGALEWLDTEQSEPAPGELAGALQALGQADLQTEIVAATQQRLDDFARTRNYDGILSACTYAASAVPQFAAEGQASVALRDATWAALYAILNNVQAGNWPTAGAGQTPTSYADIELLLPALTWPR